MKRHLSASEMIELVSTCSDKPTDYGKAGTLVNLIVWSQEKVYFEPVLTAALTLRMNLET
ncbi:MAG: hypothetical protein L0Y74_07280 [candidate division Zixibacteria bacterium]|nr:hypothetical protein [candidate division Zixibacteria bacterium]